MTGTKRILLQQKIDAKGAAASRELGVNLTHKQGVVGVTIVVAPCSVANVDGRASLGSLVRLAAVPHGEVIRAAVRPGPGSGGRGAPQSDPRPLLVQQVLRQEGLQVHVVDGDGGGAREHAVADAVHVPPVERVVRHPVAHAGPLFPLRGGTGGAGGDRHQCEPQRQQHDFGEQSVPRTRRAVPEVDHRRLCRTLRDWGRGRQAPGDLPGSRWDAGNSTTLAGERDTARPEAWWRPDAYSSFRELDCVSCTSATALSA